MWRENVWFFDFEVLPHDWLMCAESQSGDRVSFHNNTHDLAQWVVDVDPLLCGYNCKHYDNYILKAILAGAQPEEVKEVNDAIIVKGIKGWEIDMGYIPLPDSFDLMLDLPTRPSLKLIEGNLRMDIQESSVDFNTENPTPEQWEELETYCWHDVEALIPLYEARQGYLEAKETLAEMSGIPVRKALNMTNAKLTAKFLGAQYVERGDERAYVYPDNIKRELIPDEVFEFFDRLPAQDISLDILFGKEGVPDENGKVVKSRNPYRNLKIDIADCPTVVAWGGIHGAVNHYSEKTNEDRILINADVSSYYPHLMIVNGYTSRNIKDPDIFREVVEQRLEAKAKGDKRTADALKLVVNTAYGASNNKYNDLFDPLMAHSVCISGQLYLIMLVNMLNEIDSVKIININTDGVLYSVNKTEVDSTRNVLREWERLTGFTLEEDLIEQIIQRDVNNYVMRDIDGKVKVKGSVVSDYPQGDFKHNSMSVVCKAIVSHFLDNIPIEDTIMGENDPFAFQMIAKAGGSFERVIHEIGGMEFEVNRVNRIYAGKDESLGTVYKIKEGKRNKVPNCPEHAIVDNEGIIPIDKIDKSWYIELAQERVEKFLGKQRRKKMAESKEKKTATAEKKTVPSFKEKLFQLQQDVAEMASKFVKDGYNSNQSYEYVRAQQYKSIFREALTKNRLLHFVDDVMAQASDVLKSEKMTLTAYHGKLTIVDVDSDSERSYMIWSQGADNLDKGLSKAKTLAIKDFIKVNYLVSDTADDPEADAGATTSQPRFQTPAQKKDTASRVVADEKKASDEQIERIKKGIAGIRKASGDDSYGAKTEAELEKGITDSKAEIILTKLEMKGGEYGLEI